MNAKLLATVMLLCVLLIVGCSSGIELSIPTGSSTFLFQHHEIYRNTPIMVWTYRPIGYTANSKILFVIHGAGRNADGYRDAWIEIAERNNVLLLVPEFSIQQFPDDISFNLGNVAHMDSLENILSPNPENEWSYSYVEAIFDGVVNGLTNRSKTYMIYGHSAGSQFVHRLMFLKPTARSSRVVLANAGWYTLPDLNEQYPYGLRGTTAGDGNLRHAFQKDVTVLLGDADTDENLPQLRRTPQAMRQGKHRFERGHTFFEISKSTAAELKTPFVWKLETVPGVAHSNAGMAKGAEKILFGGQ